jgi:aerobic C4-dicarboxylate transport protein
MASAGKPFYTSLYFQVTSAIVLGILLGRFFPEAGTAMKPLGDGFIKLIKMIIARSSSARSSSNRRREDMVGKTGNYALLYFRRQHDRAGRATIVNASSPAPAWYRPVGTLDTTRPIRSPDRCRAPSTSC